MTYFAWTVWSGCWGLLMAACRVSCWSLSSSVDKSNIFSCFSDPRYISSCSSNLVMPERSSSLLQKKNLVVTHQNNNIQLLIIWTMQTNSVMIGATLGNNGNLLLIVSSYQSWILGKYWWNHLCSVTVRKVTQPIKEFSVKKPPIWKKVHPLFTAYNQLNDNTDYTVLTYC